MASDSTIAERPTGERSSKGTRTAGTGEARIWPTSKVIGRPGRGRWLSAYVGLAFCYVGGTIASRLRRAKFRPGRRPTRKIAVIGRFDSHNWFLSHIVPLTRSGAREVIVVSDQPQANHPGVRFSCPPRWAQRLLGRALSKLVWLVGVGWRDAPDIYVGYHIFPSAWSALLAARLFRRPACYQMTGGPIELVGGGALSDNRLMRSLRKPSRWLERLALSVAREFDLVVVRGRGARRFLEEHGIKRTVRIIPGSIESARFQGAADRRYDLVFIGRLTPIKQPLQFIDVVNAVCRVRPDTRAALVGDGPLMEEAKQLVSRHGLTDRLELLGKLSDVEVVAGQARIFVLTSRSEGLSIAMAESMAAGAVPVVANVGDLGDLVRDGANGFLVEPDNVDACVDRIVRLLEDPELWTRCSRAAVDASRAYNDVTVVTDRWRQCLLDLIPGFDGVSSRRTRVALAPALVRSECREAATVLRSPRVGIATGHHGYARHAPYSPQQAQPEYPFAGNTTSPDPNPGYEGVREALRLLDMDAENQGSARWNPLGGLIQPGQTVVLKPNLVRDFRESSPDPGDCLITHGSVIRAVLDYAYIALQGRGRLIIADAPQNDADFSAIRKITGLDEIQAFYRRHADLPVEVIDLRPQCAHKIDGVIVGHTELPGDPAGYVRVNLADRSAFSGINHLCHLLYGAEYDTRELHTHQHRGVHEYLISRTVLDADVVISIPKLKTHKKVGLTVNLKNLVGINGNKNWLPHHREGTPDRGGDQFQNDGAKYRLEQAVLTQFKRSFPRLGPFRRSVAGPIKKLGKKVFGDTNTGTVRSGNWYGNDTTWRMVLDLNRVLLYAGSDGTLFDRPVRRFFSVVDGVVAGEGNGPLDATPKPTGIVLAGGNPVAVDMACARLMGFDYRRLRLLRNALRAHSMPLVAFEARDVAGLSNEDRFDKPMAELTGPALAFRPHFGWVGNVEIAPDEGQRGVPAASSDRRSKTASVDKLLGKKAASRKNLWAATPRIVKSAIGRPLSLLGPRTALGSRFGRQLRFVRESQWWPAERSRDYQFAQLRRICSLAYRHTEYYRRIFDEVGFEPGDLKSPEDLSGLPTIDRHTLRIFLDQMCTTRPRSGRIDYVSTAGTSGMPLHFFIGAERSAVEYAYLVAGWERLGYRLGVPMAVFRGRVVSQDRSGLRHEYDPLLRHHYYSGFHMTDANMRRYVEHIRGLGPCFMHVYPSSVAVLARFLRRSGLKSPANVLGVIAESEIVYPNQRRFVRETLGCRYFSCYGHTEKLVAAVGCEHNSDYHVWPSYGYFELIGKDGRPVRTPGERGEIVGTGFINSVVPFIRYRTGDFATYVADRCQACRREHTLISDIRGHRTQEALVASDGALIPWTALNMHDDTFAHVRQFRFYQDTPGKARLNIIPAEGFGEKDRQRILRNLERKLDGRLDLTISLTDDIPPTKSGKASYVDQQIPDIQEGDAGDESMV